MEKFTTRGPMKAYTGIRLRSSNRLRVIRLHVGSPLPLYLNEVNHSPDGFECGFGGSGPAQLAYALLRDFIGPDGALKLYHAFKWTVIAELPTSGTWTLTADDIDSALARIGGVF